MENVALLEKNLDVKVSEQLEYCKSILDLKRTHRVQEDHQKGAVRARWPFARYSYWCCVLLWPDLQYLPTE